mmetsp:Transcript_118231/g.252503  ORF Transcript_118231/g.252503 Transcript_118231/m.252503 type:complete len:168 (-) Transcript_118231:156-659(-)
MAPSMHPIARLLVKALAVCAATSAGASPTSMDLSARARAASFEAAFAAVATWPPAACALHAASGAAQADDDQLGLEERAPAQPRLQHRDTLVAGSAAAADEGWGAGLGGVSTLDGSLAASLAARGKRLRPVSFTLREHSGGRDLRLPSLAAGPTPLATRLSPPWGIA